jgi:hypothetical protein
LIFRNAVGGLHGHCSRGGVRDEEDGPPDTKSLVENAHRAAEAFSECVGVGDLLADPNERIALGAVRLPLLFRRVDPP